MLARRAPRLLTSIDPNMRSISRTAADHAAHLAAIVESATDAIMGATLDGVITSWNEGAERLYGYTAEEAVGQPLALIVPLPRCGAQVPVCDLVARRKPHVLARRHEDATPEL